MKSMLLIASLSLLGTQSFAAYVQSARLDASNKNILVEVTYGGGCGGHYFSLQMAGCLESYPVQCSAQLVEETTDICASPISDTVVIPLADYSLTDSYYSGGTLTITGDKDWQTNQPSKATVTLPR